ERGLGAFVGLVVKIAAGNALEECLFLFGVGGFQIRREVARHRERRRLTLRLEREGRLPRLIPPDAERTGVRRERSAFRAEESLADVPPAFGELRGAEGDVHAAGITEQDVVIAIAIAVIGGAALASSRGGGLQGMRLEDPIADIDHMNVLL